jgi:hypothetical protein
MSDDYDFESIEIPTYEEFKKTLTRALEQNPLNWSRKRNYKEARVDPSKAESVESNTISSQEGSSPDNSPTGTPKLLNPETSQIFQRRALKKYPQADLCKKILR